MHALALLFCASFAVITAIGSPPGVDARGAPDSRTFTCRTNADTVHPLTASLDIFYQVMNDTTRTALGLANNTPTITLVTSDASCDSAIVAYNTHIGTTSDSLWTISSAFVFKADNSWAVWAPAEGSRTYAAMILFDSTLAFRRGLLGLD